MLATNKKLIFKLLFFEKNLAIKHYCDINNKKAGNTLIQRKPTCAHDSSGVLALTE